MSDITLTFERDIKPLFRDSDRAAMRKAFDLWSATDVAAHGDAIAARLRDGSMPCDGPWPRRTCSDVHQLARCRGQALTAPRGTGGGIAPGQPLRASRTP